MVARTRGLVCIMCFADEPEKKDSRQEEDEGRNRNLGSQKHGIRNAHNEARREYFGARLKVPDPRIRVNLPLNLVLIGSMVGETQHSDSQVDGQNRPIMLFLFAYMYVCKNVQKKYFVFILAKLHGKKFCERFGFVKLPVGGRRQESNP